MGFWVMDHAPSSYWVIGESVSLENQNETASAFLRCLCSQEICASAMLASSMGKFFLLGLKMTRLSSFSSPARRLCQSEAPVIDPARKIHLSSPSYSSGASTYLIQIPQ